MGHGPNIMENMSRKKIEIFQKDLEFVTNESWTGLPAFFMKKTGPRVSESELERMEDDLRLFVKQELRVLMNPQAYPVLEILSDFFDSEALGQEILQFCMPKAPIRLPKHFPGATESVILHLMVKLEDVVKTIEDAMQYFAQTRGFAIMWRLSPTVCFKRSQKRKADHQKKQLVKRRRLNSSDSETDST